MKHLLRLGLMIPAIMLMMGGSNAVQSQDVPQYRSQVLDYTFVTAEQLYHDNQIFMSAGPFIYPKPELHPFTNKVLGESYNYSRASLESINAKSGLGVHTLWGPAIGAMVGDPNDPMSRKQVLMGMIGKFAEASGATPPANAWPQFLEFESGDPHFAQPVDTDDSDGTTFANDFSSLRWDRSTMSKVVNPAALGQTMFKQVLWAEAFFSKNHRNSAGQTKLGGDPVAGFGGFVLTANAVNKMLALKNELAFSFVNWDLGSIDPQTYDPLRNLTYFPHRIAVSETSVMPGVPPKPAYTVLDRSSHLFDQTSLLWGLSEFVFYADPRLNTADPGLDAKFDRIFDGSIFPKAAENPGDMPGVFDLAKGLSIVVYKNLKTQHFDPLHRVFVDRWDPVSGRGNVVSAFDAGFTLVALANLQAQQLKTPMGTLDVSADMREHADFILNNLIDPNGGAYNGFTLSLDIRFVGVPLTSTKTLLTQTSIIQGLLKAFEVTQNTRYRDAATALFDFARQTFFDAGFQGFRTSADSNEPIIYTPLVSGAILGALRELHLQAGVDTRDLYTQQFNTVVNGKAHSGTGLVLSETPLTGERGPVDSDEDGVPAMAAANIAPVFAGSLIFELEAAK